MGNPEATNIPVAVDTLPIPNERPGSPGFDSTFTMVQDLTADGEPDSLVLQVFGRGMEDPFRWTVRIWVKSELVFEHEAVDSLVDRIFGGPGSFGGAETFGLSGDRDRDKTFYYFESLPKRVIVKAQFDAESAIFDRDSPAGVYTTLAREWSGRGLANEQSIEEIAERAVKELQSGTILISIPISPFTSRFPLIYNPELGEFIPVFVW